MKITKEYKEMLKKIFSHFVDEIDEDCLYHKLNCFEHSFLIEYTEKSKLEKGLDDIAEGKFKPLHPKNK